MHYCLPFDPILTLVTQKSVWADSVLSVRHRPLSSNTSQPNSSLQMFYSFVPNHLLPPDISKLFHSIFSFRIISVPHSPISSHFSSPFMYFSHPSPTSVDGNVSICPREHEGWIGITCRSSAERFMSVLHLLFHTALLIYSTKSVCEEYISIYNMYRYISHKITLHNMFTWNPAAGCICHFTGEPYDFLVHGVWLLWRLIISFSWKNM